MKERFEISTEPWKPPGRKIGPKVSVTLWGLAGGTRERGSSGKYLEKD